MKTKIIQSLCLAAIIFSAFIAGTFTERRRHPKHPNWVWPELVENMPPFYHLQGEANGAMRYISVEFHASTNAYPTRLDAQNEAWKHYASRITTDPSATSDK